VGGNFVASSDVDITLPGWTVEWKRVKIEPSVIGGITIGYDFIKEGFGGYDWPEWMKYFSFATDFTYNRFDMREQYLSYISNGVNIGKVTFDRVSGYMAAWTFLFRAHYGFLPDAEVPGGRLHPYVGVGPAILFSGLDLPVFGVGNMGSKSSVDVALVTEAGIRFMALKNVSLDAAFRYRWASPTYGFVSAGVGHDVSLDAHQFSFLFRANYHF
jgi:opacity protein-like surface antigen